MQYKDKDRFPEIGAAMKKPQGSCFLYVKQRQGDRDILREMILYFVNGTTAKSKPGQPAFFINLKVLTSLGPFMFFFVKVCHFPHAHADTPVTVKS
jgi:hypothetical protein